MTKAQVLAEIASKIAGQGSQVDAGGALGAVLTAIAKAAIPEEVTDITALTAAQLDGLNVGDKVAKVTGSDKHIYVVSYKAETGGGLCLTYTDASTVETVSYDRTDDGWAYNSTDKTNIGG